MFTEKTSIVIAAGLMISLSNNANTLQAPKPAPKPSPTTEINQTVSNKSLEQRPEQPETFEHWQSLKRWKEKSFVGNTRYELYKESAASERNTVQSGTTVLKATAVNSASVLYRQEAVDLTSTPWLEWSWKIESTYDERRFPRSALCHSTNRASALGVPCYQLCLVIQLTNRFFLV